MGRSPLVGSLIVVRCRDWASPLLPRRGEPRLYGKSDVPSRAGYIRIEAIRSYLRTAIACEDDCRGWIVRESDAAESQRFRLHAGGGIQDHPCESAHCGGAWGKGVSVLARSATRGAGED